MIDKVAGGVISKYISNDAFFAFHQANSFEDESGSIVIDLPTMADYSFLEAAMVPNLRANVGPNSNGSSKNDVPGTFTRYILSNNGTSRAANGSLLTQSAIKAWELDYKSSNIELPRINQQYSGKPYQYVYGIHVEKPGYFSDSIFKIDTKAGKSLTWSPKTNHLPSEPIFIPDPKGSAEDDGALVFVAMDAGRQKSSLVFLNATTMNELGRAQMPIVMGYGFHGIWGAGS